MLIVVQGLSTRSSSSSTSASSTSAQQDSCSRALGDKLRDSKKTEHTDPVQGSPLRDLPEWLGEFIDNLGVALGFGLGNEKIQEALDVLENFHRRDTRRGVPEVTIVVRSFSSRGWKATMLREEDETTLKG